MQTNFNTPINSPAYCSTIHHDMNICLYVVTNFQFSTLRVSEAAKQCTVFTPACPCV